MDNFLAYVASVCFIVIAITMVSMAVNLSHMDRLILRLTRSADAIAYSMSDEQITVHVAPQGDDGESVEEQRIGFNHV